MQEAIKAAVKEAISSFSSETEGFVVEHPANSVHGDYSTNAPMVLAKKAKIHPKELGSKICEILNRKKIRGVEKIEQAGGFVNFFLTRDFLAAEVEKAASHDSYGKGAGRDKDRVMVEYTDPNPFKEFHIGHLMSNAIGETLSRLIEFQGAEVKRVCYQGDVGIHVAKAIWGMKKAAISFPHDHIALTRKIQYLGMSYKMGAAAYENGEKEAIEKLNKQIYDRSDGEVNKLYDWGRAASLEYFDTVYARLGTKFDFNFFESDAAKVGLEAVAKGLDKGIFEKSERATVFRAEKHDSALHTRVFINSLGLPTYEAKELGLAKMKAEKFSYDSSVVITGNEVNDYFRVLLAAMKLVYPDLAKKTVHLSHGMLRLPSGKMSSRTGDVITADSLIEDVGKRVREKIRDRGYDAELAEKIVEAVSVGAIKHSILRQSIGGDIIFDLEKSISFEGDSGPYLQYSLTRAKSVLAKAKAEKVKVSTKNPPAAVPLERLLVHFGEEAARAEKETAPQRIVTYLTELSGEFNAFYAKEKIVDNSDKFSPYKLALTAAFANVMKNGLWLLAIPEPEKM